MLYLVTICNYYVDFTVAQNINHFSHATGNGDVSLQQNQCHVGDRSKQYLRATCLNRIISVDPFERTREYSVVAVSVNSPQNRRSTRHCLLSKLPNKTCNTNTIVVI